MIKKLSVILAAVMMSGCCCNDLPTSAENLARGEGYHKDGKPAKAVKAYNKALKLNPNNVDVYASRGTAYFFLKDYDKAVKDFTVVVQNNPSVAAYSALSAALTGAGRPEEALEIIDHVVRIQPDNLEARLTKGSIFFALEKYEDALNEYSILIEIAPNIDAYLARAATYEKLGKPELAKADIDRVQQGDLAFINPLAAQRN